MVENCYQLFGSQNGTVNGPTAARDPLARERDELRLRERGREDAAGAGGGGGGVETAGEEGPPPPPPATVAPTGDTGRDQKAAVNAASPLPPPPPPPPADADGGVVGMVCCGHRVVPSPSSGFQHPRSLQKD